MELRAIPKTTLEDLLHKDDAGRPPRLLTDDEGGSPLRCCLTKARPGEKIALLSYAPLRRWAAAKGIDPGPYDEVGPIFIHPSPCDGPTNNTWPHTAPRILRAYTHSGSIHSGHHLPADTNPTPHLQSLFTNTQVALIHVRAVEFGCFQFEVHPTPQLLQIV
ncbi:DUF1203 domain-containing protein [Actinocorallia lasiicapitis]